MPTALPCLPASPPRPLQETKGGKYVVLREGLSFADYGLVRAGGRGLLQC